MDKGDDVERSHRLPPRSSLAASTAKEHQRDDAENCSRSYDLAEAIGDSLSAQDAVCAQSKPVPDRTAMR